MEQDFSDNVYIVERIKDSKVEDGVEHFLIKWEGYEDETWEPATNIPQFMLNYYKKTGNGAVPTPRVAGVRKKGLILYITFSNYLNFFFQAQVYNIS